jgi:hypothetical protein
VKNPFSSLSTVKHIFSFIDKALTSVLWLKNPFLVPILILNLPKKLILILCSVGYGTGFGAEAKASQHLSRRN